MNLKSYFTTKLTNIVMLFVNKHRKLENHNREGNLLNNNNNYYYYYYNTCV